jgi:cysteine sulfinate desulfinase/cysteine desulfurase-like protein
MVAIGVEKSSANALVRFSLGKDSTDEEVEHVAKVVPEVIQRAQQFQ